jgi:hypothetical protein
LKEKVGQLEEQMEKEIEVLVAPLRLEVASAKADLMKEKAARTEDRIELADLWPPGWLMPSVLMKVRTRRSLRTEHLNLSTNSILAVLSSKP